MSGTWREALHSNLPHMQRKKENSETRLPKGLIISSQLIYTKLQTFYRHLIVACMRCHISSDLEERNCSSASGEIRTKVLQICSPILYTTIAATLQLKYIFSCFVIKQLIMKVLWCGAAFQQGSRQAELAVLVDPIHVQTVFLFCLIWGLGESPCWIFSSALN